MEYTPFSFFEIEIFFIFMQIHYIHFSCIPSTHTWAKEHYIEFNANEFTCITAEEQTAGRGREDRLWISPKGENLYLTLYFSLPHSFTCLHNLAQLLSISCCKTLETLGFSPNLKWPNDLFLLGKKIGGVLCETLHHKESVGIILGIGLNVNMKSDLLASINQPVTSLFEVSRKLFSLTEIRESLLAHFVQDLKILTQEGFAPFHSYYTEHLSYKNTLCSWKQGKKITQVLFHSISQKGTLLASLPSGDIIEILSGEIKPLKNSDLESPESLGEF